MEELIKELISTSSIEGKVDSDWVVMEILDEVEREYLDITPDHYSFNRNSEASGLDFWDCVNRYRDAIIWKN